jgi:hypothetical protein
MRKGYFRSPERPFALWKWVVFGSVYLLVLDYLSSLLDNISIFWLGVLLGGAIIVRMNIMQSTSTFLQILKGIGVSLLISLIATFVLWGYCAIQPTQDICDERQLRANAMSNVYFPLVAIFGWIVGEIYTTIKEAAHRISRTKRTNQINKHK